jgi:hypothetical protein
VENVGPPPGDEAARSKSGKGTSGFPNRKSLVTRKQPPTANPVQAVKPTRTSGPIAPVSGIKPAGKAAALFDDEERPGLIGPGSR